VLKTSNYEVWAQSSSGKPLNFTKFVISLSLNWSLSGTRATSKIVMAPEAKKQLMNVKRGTQFILQWGFSTKTYTKVVLYWTGTIWEIGDNANVSIDLVHGSWATTRVPVVAMLSDAKVKDSLQAAAKTKGVKLDTKKASEPNNGKNAKIVAVAQTVAEEIERQYKGQFIAAGKDGVTLEVTSFETLSKTAQAYYVSTEYGYLEKIAITYKATLPKDKSYIELLGGDKTAANASPNSNPSSKTEATGSESIKPEYPIYATLVSTSEVNKLQNPILNLVLFVNSKEIGRYKCTSAQAFLRDSSKTNNVIPDGQYTIASSTVQGSVPEVGGLFLPITPNFKTNRSSLGIHFDPSFNKNNGEDGTHGCIGLTTASDRDVVQKQILENKIRILVVALNEKPVTTTSSQSDSATKQAFLVSDLNSNQVYTEQSKRGVVTNVGSMFKLFIAIATVNKASSLSTQYDGQTLSSLLQSMLDSSSNESANTLIKYVGGVESLNNLCQSSGFTKTKLDSLYTDAIGQKQSNCQDLTNAFKLIFTQGKYSSLRPYLAGSSLGLAGETHTKLGTNSGFEGGISLVANTAGQKTIVCVLAKSSKEVKALVTQVSSKIP
jgi:Beta-lactamase enzyme family